ncbi:putative inositol 5-phosphatase [Aspergillus affinis]|uniref:putative inositol 5-phosphatase n=1 Tax=Aspergillus affinis TaxID=1070780 RepID=UPI0022FDC555|nr:Endonuclease/exonuclease/phosphatase [Aspergillus affinis]KAI9036508.1 Endonuclease/exonuclease/phosphatase [Aspergillus affinis]
MIDSLSLYTLTFNCARNPIDVDRFAPHFFDALPPTDDVSSPPPPDLIVLSLQEIAPIAYAFLGNSFLAPYLSAFSRLVDVAVARRWACHYVTVATENVGMTGLLVFARSDVADGIASIETAGVGLGVQQMGNKGAVGARLAVAMPNGPDDTADLTFVAAHLAPMEHAVERRNSDWRSIVERLVFSPEPAATRGDRERAGDESERETLLHDPTSSRRAAEDRRLFAPTSYLFLAGDLNYRTANVSPRQEDQDRFPRNDVEPTSPRHYSHLLRQDQLTREMKQSRCFHGLSEAPITFAPTYKYTHAARRAAARVGTSEDDDDSPDGLWTRTRWPSWCDRILYLETPPGTGREEARVRAGEYRALPLFPTSDHRAVALSVSVPLTSVRPGDGTAPTAPFPIDPAWESKRDAARRKELAVGGLAYLALTWEGNGLLVASAIGVFGAWLVLRSLFNA